MQSVRFAAAVSRLTKGLLMSMWCLAGLALSAWSMVPLGTELQYAGTLSRSQKTGSEPEKTFSIAALVVGTPDRPALAWQLEERGGGGWEWPERFGRWESATADKSRPVRLLHLFEGNPFVVPVRSLLFEFRDQLRENSEWTEGQHRYVCRKSTRHKDRECWIVDVSLDRGRRQTLFVEASTGLLVSLEERLFLGRGDEFELKLDLQSVKPQAAESLTKTQELIGSLLDLQTRLARGDGPQPRELSPEQVATATAAVDTLRQQSEGTGWSRLVETIARDVTQQTRRLDGISGLEKRFVGQPATWQDLRLLSGDQLTAEKLKDRVVVLHFWEYDGDKLIEPYGQVGYLEFLNQRRGKLGASIVGVAVDARFGDPAKSGSAVRTVRKLQEFMNLAYPIAFDDGGWIKSFGDPRALGATLPLWVVVGHDGRIVHYHAGNYQIQPDEGLKQLDAAVIDALKKQRAAEKVQN